MFRTLLPIKSLSHLVTRRVVRLGAKTVLAIAVSQPSIRHLYEDNGIESFNLALRKLLYGKGSLVERVNQFFELRRVDILTLGQFLSTFDNKEYPLVTYQTLEVLNLDTTQTETAYKQALEENNISSSQNYSQNTLEYLQATVVFHEIKRLLGIELYFDINNMLWLARERTGEEPPSTLGYSKWRMGRAIKQVVQIFQSHYATRPETAKTLGELGLELHRGIVSTLLRGRNYKGYALQELLEAKVVLGTPDGRYYLQEDKARQMQLM